jgi:SAM-dependent methyltransferase
MNNELSFDPAFFSKLKDAESDFFWFLVRRNWIFNAIKKDKASPSKFLEIGCGTGNVSSFLAKKGYEVVGCEYYKEALDIAWSGFAKVQGSALALPFPDVSFDVVGLFDVIEHFENETPLLKEAHRVLKQDGLLLLAVPARSELWSYIDDISFHKRRYDKASMGSLLKKSGFQPVSIEYIFMSLYLPMKLLRRKQGQAGDLLKINKTINFIARLILELERILARVIDLPIGTSIIAIAKK